MLPEPMQSCLVVSKKSRDQDCISRLFRTILSFCSMLEFFLCKFGEICVILVRHLQQPVIIKKLTISKWKLPKRDIIQTTLHWVFSVQYCLESLGQHCTEILPVQCCPKSITTLLNRIFSCKMLSGASWTTLHKVFTCAMFSPKSIKTTMNRTLPVQCCLETFGQHGTKFFQLLVQSCPKKIKTTLRKIFLVQCCLQPQGQYYIGFFLWNIVPIVLRQHCT